MGTTGNCYRDENTGKELKFIIQDQRSWYMNPRKIKYKPKKLVSRSNNLLNFKEIIDISFPGIFNTIDENYKDQTPSELKPGQDDLFPLALSSIDKEINEIPDKYDFNEKEILKNLSWERPSTIYKDLQYTLYDRIDINDIAQGYLGNCYFISALISLAADPDRVKELFVTKTKSLEGKYSVIVYVQGIPTVVTVDDYFPVYKKKDWIFASSDGTGQVGQIWVQVLEKAWAKLHGSYYNSASGHPSEGLLALSPAPCFDLIHKQFSCEEVWERLKDSRFNDYVMVTSTIKKDSYSNKGIVSYHAYTILDLFTIEKEQIDTLKLLKLKNPWSGFDWKGDYSSTSSKWTDEEKKIVGFNPNDKGVFYITLSDFLEYFDYTFISKTHKGFKYSYVKLTQTPLNSMVACNMKVESNSHKKTFLGLHAKQRRFNHESTGLQMITLIVTKFNSRKRTYEYITSGSQLGEKIFLELGDLQIGDYHVFAHVHCNSDQVEDLVISAYCPSCVDFKEIEFNHIPNDYFIQIAKDCMVRYTIPQYNELDTSKNLMLLSSLEIPENLLGFVFFLIRNKSGQNLAKASFVISYRQSSLLCLSLHKHSKLIDKDSLRMQDSFDLLIYPGEEVLVAYKCLIPRVEADCRISEIKYSYKPMEHLDQLRRIIQDNIQNVSKQKINDDCWFGELEYEDGVLIVFSNQSHGNNYRFKILFEEMENLKIAYPHKIPCILTINAGKYEFICLEKIQPHFEYDYDIEYVFKLI